MGDMDGGEIFPHLDNLTYKQAQVLHLREHEALSYDEIGARMGIVRSTVYKVYKRAKQKMEEARVAGRVVQEVESRPESLIAAFADRTDVTVTDKTLLGQAAIGLLISLASTAGKAIGRSGNSILGG